MLRLVWEGHLIARKMSKHYSKTPSKEKYFQIE
jgi:hypothetical protein